MSRNLVISYAQLLETPRTGFDLATGQGEISVTYTVGEVIPAVTNEDGSILGPLERPHPTAVLVGTATVSLGPTDTAAERMQALIALICQQEQLDPTNGIDHVLGADGTILV